MIEKIEERDHSYIKNKDNIYFCVGGTLHNRESIMGQPYYFPKESIETILDKQIQSSILIEGHEFCKLTDIISLKEYPDFIKDHFKDYYYSPAIWPLLMKVDRDNIIEVLNPNTGRKRIEKKYGQQKDHPLIYLLGLIKMFDGDLHNNTGITGSLLLHNDFNQLKNDVDLVIHGNQNISKSQEFSVNACTSNNRFSFLDGDKLEEFLDIKSNNFPGTREQLAKLSKKRWDLFFVDNLKVDLTFSSKFDSTLNSYDLIPNGKKNILGKVVDMSGSYYLPTEIIIETENSLEKVVITSRGYICLFNHSDIVEVSGEEYFSKDGQRYTVINGLDNSYLFKK